MAPLNLTIMVVFEVASVKKIETQLKQLKVSFDVQVSSKFDFLDWAFKPTYILLKSSYLGHFCLQFIVNRFRNGSKIIGHNFGTVFLDQLSKYRISLYSFLP